MDVLSRTLLKRFGRYRFCEISKQGSNISNHINANVTMFRYLDVTMFFAQKAITNGNFELLEPKD